LSHDRFSLKSAESFVFASQAGLIRLRRSAYRQTQSATRHSPEIPLTPRWGRRPRDHKWSRGLLVERRVSRCVCSLGSASYGCPATRCEAHHAAILRSPSQSVRNPATWFQLTVIRDAIKPGFGRAFSLVSASASVSPYSGPGRSNRTATIPARVRYPGMHYLSACSATLNIESRTRLLITFAVSNVLRYYCL